MRGTMSFILGILFGGMIGAVAGLVLAPYAGEETRERMRANVEEIINEGRLAAESRRSELESQLEQLRGR
ncbi:MAG: YtxH domain-containing protein [Chloroflexota bacterium]|jgi:gas vesicle protein|nr:YtxH domain-containing protein [Chloroflexota bacterium]